MKGVQCVSAPVLHIDSVTKSYRDTIAVRDLTLRVEPGCVLGLLGPNGSGKTTTIRMILGILLPDEGSIQLWDRPVRENVRSRVGYLPEERGLYPSMKVLEHLVFLAELHGVSRAEARSRAQWWLDDYDATDWSLKKVEQLSKGQQQTVQLIGALLHEPDLLILDEPFSGLDPVNTERLRGVITRLAGDGTTVVLSTHRMDQAERLCDSLCLISNGHKILEGTLGEARKQYGHDTVCVEFAEEVDDDGSAFTDASDTVLSVERHGNELRFVLADGADSQAVLQHATTVGHVKRFELLEPTLEEMFVDAVKDTK
jgi:ABC-2 type transport system ATP-binding protein